MKNMLLIFFLIFILDFIAEAQTDSSFIKYRSYENELGIDINPLLDQFLNWHSDNNGSYYPYFPNSSYYFWYKRSIGKVALRGKVGWYFVYQRDTGGYNSNSNIRQKESDIYFRPGIEWRHYFGKHWELNYGGEVISSYGYHLDHYGFSNLGPPKHTINTLVIGGAPFVGASFILNSRLSFATESSVDFYYSHQKGNYEYSLTPELNTTELHKYATVQFVYPIFIYINLRF